jgi:hypothetical protein
MRSPLLLALLGCSFDTDPRIEFLHKHQWVCLGAEALTGVVHWTNIERGLGPGGPVAIDEAVAIQEAANKKAASVPPSTCS